MKVYLLYVGPKNVLFAGVCVTAPFSPEMSQAGAVKGLSLGAKQKELKRCNLFAAKCHWNERKPIKKTI